MPADFTTLVSVCSGVAVIIGLIKILNAPLSQIEKNKEDIKKLQEAEASRKETDRAILNGLQAMTNHMIDGNGIAELKKSRDELNKAITEIATK